MVEKYRQHKASGIMERACRLCVATEIMSFEHWKIIKNEFPYDLIAKAHDMIVPKRHVNEEELTPREWEELHKIKYSSLQTYDILMEGTRRTKSIPQHFHIHLIQLIED